MKFKLLLTFIFLVFIDQLTKFLITDLVLNQGVSFGWQQGISKWILLLLMLVVILVFRFGFTKKSSFSNLMKIIFLAGAFSNLVDRFFIGGVRDWLNWPIFNFSNNLADIWITLGFSGIIYEELILSFQKRKKDTHDDRTKHNF